MVKPFDIESHSLPVTMQINGVTITRTVEARTLLTDFLRLEAGLTGPRFACEEGACGACTVEVDGEIVKSCLMLAVQADGSEITTVEGITPAVGLSTLQQAFVHCHALQCGYCTAGMLMSARDFLNKQGEREFSDEDSRQALTGNLCRCTGYNNILHALKVATGRAQPLAILEEQLEPGAKKIGQPIARREDRRLVTGGGHYVDNFSTPQDLHLAIVRSTRAHARIINIATEQARRAPGVVRIMTGAEAQAHWKPIAPTMELPGVLMPRAYAMALDKVIFYGEPVAWVAADTPAKAEDAARLVEVTYEDLPVNADMRAAAEAGAGDPGLLYPAWQSNVQRDFQFSIGDVDEVFAAADLVVDEVITSHRYGAMPLETRVTYATYNPHENTLVVRASTQLPHPMRMFLSQVFGLPESRVQVLAGDVGGGFGAKLSVDTELVVVLAAIILGRPVKWFETRTEWITAGPAARDFQTRVRAAFKRDGTLLALETDVLADMGCDGTERACGLGMPLNSGVYAPGPYLLDTYRTRVRCVVTNKAPYNAYRGYGKDLANLYIERILDQGAARLGIDLLDLRRRNLLTRYPHRLCTGPIIENGSLREALELIVKKMDLPRLRAEQEAARREGRYLGFSVAAYIEPAGGAFPGSYLQNAESATVRIAADGSVHVMTGIQSIGQGIETAYAQVTADVLGCKLEDVRISWGDTTAIPFGCGSYSSRGAMYAVGAIVNAAEVVRARVVAGAAVLLQSPAEELKIENGEIFRPGWDSRCTFAEVAHGAYFSPGAEIVLAKADAPILESTNIYRHPQVSWNFDELGRAQLYPSHPGGAAAALVEVDIETGRVDVKKIWMVSDHGVVLNPVILSGQTKGAVVQQIGGTLYENFHYNAHGIPQARTLKEYGMPTVWAAPEIDVFHLETPSPATKIGAKGAGEDGCIATSTVLMGAVENALRPLGVKVMDSTLSPAHVMELIQRAQENPAARS
ncbi:MAG: 2Fe-2S iron-sulfur cluster binding domain-containing protein [Gammaproteobacteria bacterium]|nr:2Fe-2S iron-sulfur cluster binding domain-containing protein [Gammaproteobacteria bacterium]